MKCTQATNIQNYNIINDINCDISIFYAHTYIQSAHQSIEECIHVYK